MTTSNLPAQHPSAARRMLMLGTAALTGLAATGPLHAETGHSHPAKMPAQSAPLVLAQSPEGGEGGESATARLADPDSQFLADLAFIEGHLRAGTALYQMGARDAAMTHMKHPQDEIYTALKPQLESRKAGEFSDQLTRLARSAESGGPVDEVQAAFDEVVQQINKARDVGSGGDAARLRAIILIVHEAAMEYQEGVQNGNIIMLHEYQDAWGFVQAAKAMTETLADSKRPEIQAVVKKIREQFDVIVPIFPSLLPPEGTQLGNAGVLFGAAARIELASLAVR